MQGSFVVLTGASGSGKTTLARAIQKAYPDECDVFFFDSIGVPSVEEMKARYGEGHQPGGAWLRAMTLEWMERIAAVLRTGRSVLFEGQMRMAFLREAMAASGVTGARVLLVDCADATRVKRLSGERAQPELANEQMMGWAKYLRDEAGEFGYEVLDTDARSFEECVELIHSYLHA